VKFELRSNDRTHKKNVGTGNDMLKFPDPVGNTVSYSQPLLTNPLHSLPSAIANSTNLQKLAGRTYFLESNYGYISEAVPATEYYKFGLNRIRDNLHAIGICEGRIQNLLIEISHNFEQNKEQRHNQQYSISFEREAYELRTEISNHIFLVRAVLDILSTLFQTVYGPSVGQFSSFGDLLKAIKNEKIQLPDDELKNHLCNNIEWFYLLKDVRDYLAH
jgi:hypothetical protein